MTRTRYGESPWVDEVPKRRRPDFSRFKGTESVSVAIVGGGLAGCLTAYAFAAAGIKGTVIKKSIPKYEVDVVGACVLK